MDGVSGKRGVIAQILHVVAAEPAIPIYAANPGDANTAPQRQLRRCTGGHLAHNLVTGDELRVNRRQVPFGYVQVGPANSTGQNSQQHIARLQLGFGDLLNLEERLGRLAARYEDGSLHFLASSSLSLCALEECSCALTVNS
jgi:hypothetical protein